MNDGSRAAERVARESYGRLVALLAYQWRDLAAAEDALGEAFAAALRHWPHDGVPTTPEAWLMTAARRKLLERARHGRVEQAMAATAGLDEEAAAPDDPAVPDARLRLMYVCAHPEVPEAIRAPLMLQTVLGIDSKTIADAWLVSPAAMAQRLVRAKAMIRDAGIRFEEPEARELPDRLWTVLESIYGAYTIGKQRGLSVTGAGLPAIPAGLTDEAVYLCRVVVSLQPSQAEAHGLLALLLYCEARRPAQFDGAGRFVALESQDTRLWRRDLIDEAEAHLWQAAAQRQAGQFQIEAAIQSAHCQRRSTGTTPWQAIVQLYGVLTRHYPSIGAQVGHAVALAEAGHVAAGLDVLAHLPTGATRSYPPYWVARAHLLGMDQRPEAAREALMRAIGLTEDERLRAFLRTRLR